MSADDPQQDQQGVTRSGLDPNERLPDGRLKQSAKRHPEDFTRNTGEGGTVQRDGMQGEIVSPGAEAIIPSDAPGG